MADTHNQKASPTSPPGRGDWRLSRRKRWKVATAALAGKLVMHLLAALLRMRKQPFDSVARHRRDGVGLIFAIFHGSHFPTLRAYRNRGAYVITSKSADGEILTRILGSFGFKTVRGSSTRGGTRAAVDLAQHVKAGSDAAIAVDGPRGPRHEAKPGTILLAKLTGCSIIPSAAALSRYWQVNSWDKYRIPKPFSRAVIVFGEAMTVPPDANAEMIEAKRVELQKQMIDLQHQADEAVATEEATQRLLAERTSS